jgi:predicted metal-dependent enzyme (double-stranded beta helix superfamily)
MFDLEQFIADCVAVRATPLAVREVVAGAKSLCGGEVQPLRRDIIHSVLNPVRRLTGAIHVYDGDFFAAVRSEWDPEALVEQPSNLETTLALFEESNRLSPAS